MLGFRTSVMKPRRSAQGQSDKREKKNVKPLAHPNDELMNASGVKTCRGSVRNHTRGFQAQAEGAAAPTLRCCWVP